MIGTVIHHLEKEENNRALRERKTETPDSSRLRFPLIQRALFSPDPSFRLPSKAPAFPAEKETTSQIWSRS